MARTLLQLAGADVRPARLADGVLVLIDIQNEYFDGPLRLSGVEAAAAQAATLLSRARAAGTPVIHVRHRGRAGGAFDPDAPRGQIHASVAPAPGEAVIDKGLPNSFAGTTLADALAAHPGKPLIVAGFMTHMCVSATVRAALDAGRFSTVAMDATATRDLPDPMGGVIAADTIHRAALAALADRFAVVCASAEIPD
ncbi:cysteine hydrolase [Limibaculum sp. FT325]|uniref:cysteine hydrolase family protein n=1 Tax=Thermohalobaculum sediminis TaxID=2939436 RepID=UPI0020C05565|nr:cysteine hydrolase family protein [Limibaculum sediminis]MCL5776738.1 cysteine hydrolase [Limibaculum sediminis]